MYGISRVSNYRSSDRVSPSALCIEYEAHLSRAERGLESTYACIAVESRELFSHFECNAEGQIESRESGAEASKDLDARAREPGPHLRPSAITMLDEMGKVEIETLGHHLQRKFSMASVRTFAGDVDVS